MPPSKVWKKKYECKRGKGKHDWYPHGKIFSYYTCKIADGRYLSSNLKQLIESKKCVGKIEVTYWVEWRCKACGKLAIETYPIAEKKFDHSRENLYKK